MILQRTRTILATARKVREAEATQQGSPEAIECRTAEVVALVAQLEALYARMRAGERTMLIRAADSAPGSVAGSVAGLPGSD